MPDRIMPSRPLCPGESHTATAKDFDGLLNFPERARCGASLKASTTKDWIRQRQHPAARFFSASNLAPPRGNKAILQERMGPERQSRQPLDGEVTACSTTRAWICCYRWPERVPGLHRRQIVRAWAHGDRLRAGPVASGLPPTSRFPSSSPRRLLRGLSNEPAPKRFSRTAQPALNLRISQLLAMR